MSNTEKDKEIWFEGFKTLFPTWDGNDLLEERELSQIRVFMRGVQSNYVRKQIIQAQIEVLMKFAHYESIGLEVEKLNYELYLLDNE